MTFEVMIIRFTALGFTNDWLTISETFHPINLSGFDFIRKTTLRLLAHTISVHDACAYPEFSDLDCHHVPNYQLNTDCHTDGTGTSGSAVTVSIGKTNMPFTSSTPGCLKTFSDP